MCTKGSFTNDLTTAHREDARTNKLKRYVQLYEIIAIWLLPLRTNANVYVLNFKYKRRKALTFT